jgi:uncharacterized protein YjbI with pentapeptide repeats
LRDADLSGSDLSGANLKDVEMITANKFVAYCKTSRCRRYRTPPGIYVVSSGDAENLTQAQLDKACGDANTKVPSGFAPMRLCLAPKLTAEP